MPIPERIRLIRRIEEMRGSKVICYLTSLRPGIQSQIAEDAVRVMFDHLLLLGNPPIPKLDIFLCSNGGASQVPWRLVSLFREFADSFNVLIPYRAYSAATLLALGADEIVMHPFAELGPIDPTVTNAFNPKDEDTKGLLGISVEDVKAYVQFIKTTVGITHEDELVKTIEILAQKVHPLAIGNVERFISQSRMMARKVLRTHMRDADDHVIDEIVENLASKLYFHGHPINRKEAKFDLKLQVTIALSQELETALWELYKEYDTAFDNRSLFHPLGDTVANLPAGWVTQLGQHPVGQPVGVAQQDYELLYAVIESAGLTSKYISNRRYTLIRAPLANHQALTEDILSQGWTHVPVEQAD